MHKININLHNLKTALIFSMEILWDYSSWHGLRIHVPNYIIFRRSAAEIRGGWPIAAKFCMDVKTHVLLQKFFFAKNSLFIILQ